MWLALFVWCCCFLVFPSSCDEGGDCFPYSLQNECTSVLFGKNVSIEEGEQSDFFYQNVSLIVSDIRMVQESCRRPYLSYYCQLLFGSFSCESSSFEEEECLQEEYCIQVADACANDFKFDCPQSSTPPTNNDCKDQVSKEINEVKKKPIAVQTCLDSSKEPIECCIDPFIDDDHDECVVQCFQYLYGETWENSVRIFCFILSWLSLLLWASSVIPLYMVTDLSYPNNIVFLSILNFTLSYLMLNWSTFVGGADSFVCDGKKNFWKARNDFVLSTRSVFQYSLWVCTILSGLSFWCVFSFNLFCASMRRHTTYFEKFIKQPALPVIQYSFLGICIGLMVGLFFGCLIYGLAKNDYPLSNLKIVPLPIYFFPSQGKSTVLAGLFVYPALVCGGLGGIFNFLSTVLILQRGREIVYFQWRSILFGIFGVILSILLDIYIFILLAGISDSNIILFMDCVASHPQENPPPCQREYSNGYAFMMFHLFTSALPGSACLIFYWTNSSILIWWKEFIFSKRILTQKSNYEEVGERIDSLNQF